MESQENNTKIITIIGDSLSMVSQDDGLKYKDLYMYKLQEKLGPDFDIITRTRRANTVKSQTLWQYMHDDILYNQSKYLVIYLGIVDCAPRIFSKLSHYYLKLIRPKKIVENYIAFKSRHRRFFTKYFPKTYSSKKQFKNGLEYILKEIKQKTEVKKVFIVNIADTNEKNRYRSYNYEKNINDYNKILEQIVSQNNQLCDLIDMYQKTRQNPSLILKDGIHLSKQGHDVLAEMLYNKIIFCEK